MFDIIEKIVDYLFRRWPQEEVQGGESFTYWLLQRRGHLFFAISIVSAVYGWIGSYLPDHNTPQDWAKLAHWLPLIMAAIQAVVILAVMIAIALSWRKVEFPKNNEKGREVFSKFMFYWQAVWASWFFLYLILSLRQLTIYNQSPIQYMFVEIISHTTLIFTALLQVIATNVLRPIYSNSPSNLLGLWFPVLLCCGLILADAFFKVAALECQWNLQMMRPCMTVNQATGCTSTCDASPFALTPLILLFAGLAIVMLTGRLRDAAPDQSSIYVALIYLYGLIQTYIATVGQAQLHIQFTFGITAALFLKLLWYLNVYWLIDTNRLQHYVISRATFEELKENSYRKYRDIARRELS